MTLCISFFSCTNLLYIYKMGMKSLFVQLDNSVVIAFITDHTAKSGILQILTKNQRIHVLHAVIFHLQNIKKEINALYSLKIFCPWKEEKCHSDSNKDIRYQCSSSVCWRTCWRNAGLQFCQLPCLNNIWKWNKIKSGERTSKPTSDKLTVKEKCTDNFADKSDFLYRNWQHTLGLLPRTSGFPALDLGGLSPTRSLSVGCWRSSRRCHVLWLR